MILLALLRIVFNLMSLLIPVALPGFGGDVSAVLNQATTYIIAGLDMLRFFFGADTLVLWVEIINFVITVDVFLNAWKLFVWIFKKIPIINWQE